MRTYTRKKPEYQFITGVHELCRLCLGDTNASVPIFTEEVNDNICSGLVGLPLRIMICVGLEITHDEYLPNMICMKCFKELESYYAFRKKCEVTYQKLKSHILAVKEREHQKALELKYKQNKIEPVEACNNQLDTVQHLMLTFNENQQVELVNVVNMKTSYEHEDQQVLPANGLLNEVHTNNEDHKLKNETQDTPVSNHDLSPLEIEPSNADVSLILSTILMELGILQQQDGKLVVLDNSLKTVEFEGQNSSKVVLELVEEDEEQSSSNVGEPIQNYVEKTLDNVTENHKVQEPLIKKFILKNNGAWCETCGRSFSSRTVLARHARVHTGERPHACRLCQRRFAQREVMLRHELVHQEQRPFKCDVCSKSFTQRGSLTAHARVHLPRHQRALALRACPHPACGKVFLHHSGLTRHMLTHKGKLFECDVCGHQFRDRSSLLRHMRKTHPSTAGTYTHPPAAEVPTS